MEPNTLFNQIVEERREKLKKFLLECSHYDKERLIRGSKNRGIFGDNQDDEQVYHAIKQFASFHKIEIHTPVPEIKIKDSGENTFIEEVDSEGNVKLKKVGEEDIKHAADFRAVLEKERDELSKRLLKINELLKLYT